MAKKMTLTVEKGEIELGKSGVTVRIRNDTGATMARIHLSRATLSFYELDKEKPNLRLNIDKLIAHLRGHGDYKK
jgi:hypothetical protein